MAREPQAGAGRSWRAIPERRSPRAFPRWTRRPIASHSLWTHHVPIFGVVAQPSIYELDPVATLTGRALRLNRPDELSIWNGNLYFTDDTIEVFGRRGRITPAVSAHPCLSLCRLPQEMNELERQRRISTNPTTRRTTTMAGARSRRPATPSISTIRRRCGTRPCSTMRQGRQAHLFIRRAGICPASSSTD